MQTPESSRNDYSQRVAVSFITHVLEKPVLDRFVKLDREAPAWVDVYLLFDQSNQPSAELQSVQEISSAQLEPFNEAEVTNINFPHPWADATQRTLVPGNVDLLYLDFASRHPQYSKYWFIEYDVAYTGSWSDIFQVFEDSDAELLGTTLQNHAVRPNWYWWPTFLPKPAIDTTDQLCGFFPIIRLASELLDRLRAAYNAGWSGHAEAVIPTLARYHGLTLEDIGGDGPYVKEENIDRFYTNTPHSERLSPGTFVYRPARPQPGSTPKKLYHPVKPAASD